MSQCQICEKQLSSTIESSGSVFFDCPCCGTYSLSSTVQATLPHDLRTHENSRAILSYALYRMTRKESKLMLTSSLIQNILSNTRLPQHNEQLDNFIVWIAEKTSKYGRHLGEITPDAIPSVGAEDITALNFVITHALDLKLVSGVRLTSVFEVIFSQLALTFAGWSRLDEIQRGNTPSHIAFMAMKFGDQETENLYQHHFKPAVKACGFELKRLDESQPAGLIDDRLRLEIRQCRFVIADLTHQNNGAYWEAGFAEGLGKPVIYTCRRDEFEDKSKGTHFDTNHHLTVVWESASLDKAIEKLKSTIRATLPSEAKLSD